MAHKTRRAAPKRGTQAERIRAAIRWGTAALIAAGCGAESTPTSPAAANLAFTVQPPAEATAGYPITPAVVVAVQNSTGSIVTSASTRITIGFASNPGNATLSGTATMTAVNGVATFSNLIIDKTSTGYTLSASADGLTGVTSSSFSVRSGFRSVSAGGLYNTCGLTTGGTGVCWGYNSYGALGTGDYVDFYYPVPVSGGAAFTMVTAGGANGGSHACGVATGGAAYCWGYNRYGELGSGSIGSTVPVKTPTAVSGGLVFATLSAGAFHTCGLTNAGVGYCWGDNDYGQLGDGSIVDTGTPVAVSGGLTFAVLEAGGSFSCGLTIAGAAYCWGYNADGRLGNGSATNSSVPVAVSGGLVFASMAVGGPHACGVTAAGAAYCWGFNSYGQLGNLSTNNSSTPAAVAGGMVFRALSAGTSHSCGVTASGAAYCWGRNAFGQLGSGSTSNSLTPFLVSGGLIFSALSAGGSHSCGVTTSGVAYCWGYNAYGALGKLTTGSSLTPARVFGPP